MILLDVNILIYGSIASDRRHAAANQWLDEQLNGSRPVGLPWTTAIGYLRIVTDSRIFRPPVPMPTAWQRMSSWLSATPVWMPQPTEQHAKVLAGILELPGMQGKLVPDAHLAALAIEHGLILCSTDGDFARFPGLRWENPLTA